MAALSAHQRPPAHADRGVRPQRHQAGHPARGRRLRPRRAVERRLPPRRPRRADRRDRRLLRRLRAAGRAGQGARPRASSTTAPSPRSARPTTARRSTPHAMPHLAPGGLQPEPRPDRQPRRRRPDHRGPRRRPARLRRAAHPVRARSRRCSSRARSGRPSTPFQFFTSHPEPELGKATAEGRIAEFAKMGWDPDGRPRPAGPGDLRALQARLERGRAAAAAPADARRLPRPGRAAPRPPGAHRPRLRRAPRSSTTRPPALLALHRGDLGIHVNLGDAEQVPRRPRPHAAVRDPRPGHPRRRRAHPAAPRRRRRRPRAR